MNETTNIRSDDLLIAEETQHNHFNELYECFLDHGVIELLLAFVNNKLHNTSGCEKYIRYYNE